MGDLRVDTNGKAFYYIVNYCNNAAENLNEIDKMDCANDDPDLSKWHVNFKNIHRHFDPNLPNVSQFIKASSLANHFLTPTISNSRIP